MYRNCSTGDSLFPWGESRIYDSVGTNSADFAATHFPSVYGLISHWQKNLKRGYGTLKIIYLYGFPIFALKSYLY